MKKDMFSFKTFQKAVKTAATQHEKKKASDIKKVAPKEKTKA